MKSFTEMFDNIRSKPEFWIEKAIIDLECEVYRNPQYKDAINSVIDAIKSWDTRTRGWISVDERLPKPDTTVLGYMPTVDYWYGLLIHDGESWIDWVDESYEPNGEVTHWMPLPAPPEDKK